VASENYAKENKIIKLSKEEIEKLYQKGLPEYRKEFDIRDEIKAKSKLD
jgi:hypothetical protein